MHLNLDECYSKKVDSVTREIAGEAIIVPVKSRAAELDAIYTLNELGALIWQSIDGKTTVSLIVEGICNLYDVARETATRDIVEFFETLEAEGLIRPVVDR